MVTPGLNAESKQYVNEIKLEYERSKRERNYMMNIVEEKLKENAEELEDLKIEIQEFKNRRILAMSNQKEYFRYEKNLECLVQQQIELEKNMHALDMTKMELEIRMKTQDQDMEGKIEEYLEAALESDHMKSKLKRRGALNENGNIIRNMVEGSYEDVEYALIREKTPRSEEKQDLVKTIQQKKEEKIEQLSSPKAIVKVAWASHINFVTKSVQEYFKLKDLSQIVLTFCVENEIEICDVQMLQSLNYLNFNVPLPGLEIQIFPPNYDKILKKQYGYFFVC